MHTRDYKQHGAPDSRAKLHNAVRAHNSVLGGGIVAESATGVGLVERDSGMVGGVGGGVERDYEIVSAPKMLSLR